VIFLDTGFLFALVYADDVHHARVREVLESRRRSRTLPGTRTRTTASSTA